MAFGFFWPLCGGAGGCAGLGACGRDGADGVEECRPPSVGLSGPGDGSLGKPCSWLESVSVSNVAVVEAEGDEKVCPWREDASAIELLWLEAGQSAPVAISRAALQAAAQRAAEEAWARPAEDLPLAGAGLGESSGESEEMQEADAELEDELDDPLGFGAPVGHALPSNAVARPAGAV